MEVGWWALIVASLSFVVSAATFWRNRARRPHLELAGHVLAVRPKRLEVTVVNRGPGVAHDVQFGPVDGVKGLLYGERAERLGFAEGADMNFFLEPGDRSVTLQATWSQEPNLRKRRSKRVVVEISAG